MRRASLLIHRHRFLNCQGGGKRPGLSILKVGVEEAMRDAGFDNDAFVARGGIFQWSRGLPEPEALDW
jgi:radical S-adenosyl methionine domain-containing protein 2